MFFDMATLPGDIRYKLLTATVTPRPIAWITSRSSDGIDNAAPFSFFNVMGHQPPTVAVGLLRSPNKGLKDTAQNILATGEFIVHLVPMRLAEAMNATAADVSSQVDELQLAAVRTEPALKVAATRIVDSPVAFECRSLSSVVTGPQQVVVIGEVLCVHIADEHVLDASRGYIDTPSLDLISRMHGAGWYARMTDLFEMERPSAAAKERSGKLLTR